MTVADARKVHKAALDGGAELWYHPVRKMYEALYPNDLSKINTYEYYGWEKVAAAPKAKSTPKEKPE